MIDKIKKIFFTDGFVILKKSFFDIEEIEKIKIECDKILNKEIKVSDSDILEVELGGKTRGIRRLTQHSDIIFNYINKLITNKEIDFFLKETLGSNYKITEIIYRHSEPNDVGLGVHQDADNEHTLVINLDDTNNINGSTIFLKKSHNFTFDIIKSFHGNSISEKISNNLIFLFNWFQGNAGDIGFFSNKVWHGRARNSGKKKCRAIMIGFYPSGSIIKFDDDYKYFSKNYFLKNKNKELCVRQNYGVELFNNEGKFNYYKIKDDCNFDIQKKIKNNFYSFRFLIFFFVSKSIYTVKKFVE